jgi:hypothetical protein
MVVASTLTFLAANKKLGLVSKGKLVEMAMENERRVGVNSGGYVIFLTCTPLLTHNKHAVWIRPLLSCPPLRQPSTLAFSPS